MKFFLKFAALLFLAAALGACRTPPPDRAAVLDVRQFGAAGDGKTLDTAAIQRALDECGRAGGGTVRLPAGTYLSKPIFLRGQTTLELEAGAVLQATDDPADYLDGNGATLAFVNARGLAHITLGGAGAIDGAGARWWPAARAAKSAGRPETTRRPRLVVLTGCRNVLVRDVTLRNSPSFHLVPADCQDVVVSNVTILAPADSPNTDAMDPSACQRVLITRCRLDVGDDNIAIKSGRAVPGRAAACEDFVVSDCVFLRGHGMSIGSETLGGVSNLLVTHCAFDGTTSGIRLKTSRDRGGTVENLIYKDITMTNVQVPVNIACYYPNVPAADPAQPVSRTTPVCRNIQIINLTASGPKSAGFIVGLPEMCVSNVLLENVKLSTATGLTIRNARGIQFINSDIQAQKGPPVIAENAEIAGLAEAKK
ncbi:MAG: glycoside hydrolase family 28 protein [Verrucomicrobiota bacterium]|jgi:polygalacturonase